MIDLQLSQMDAAHRNARPSHISLILRKEADSRLLPEIESMPEIAGIDAMTPLSIQFRASDESEWRVGTLIFRNEPNNQRYDLTTLTNGDWPSENSIAVEQMSAQYSGITPGNQVEIKTPETSANLRISAIVRHPFVKPPRFGGQIHFFASPALTEKFGLKPNSFRQLLAQVKTPYSEEKARETAKKIREFLNRRGSGVSVTLLQDPEKHWGRPLLAGIDHVLQLMAFASLFLASVLIFNTVSAHITQQTSQIGIMKSLGAARYRIAQLYLLETALIACFAIALALTPALVAAHFSAHALLGLFNIESSRFDASPRAIALMTTGGLAAPMLAALWPILRGASMNVREALSSYGLVSDFGGNAIDRWVDRFSERFLSTLNATAFGNLFRRKGRLILTQSVLIIAGVIFLILMSLIASVNRTLDNEMARSQYSVKLGFSNDQSASAITPLIKSIQASQSIEFWQRLPLEISKHQNTLKQKGSLGLQLLALPAGSEMYRPYIESGRWLRPEDSGQRVLVISANWQKISNLASRRIIPMAGWRQLHSGAGLCTARNGSNRHRPNGCRNLCSDYGGNQQV
jgi:putative ABC transport system permease protein